MATTSSNPGSSKEALLEAVSGKKDAKERLHTLSLDVTDEGSIQKAAKDVESRFGKELRFLINVSGILNTEKSITKLVFDDMKKTFDVRSCLAVNWVSSLSRMALQINTFGHLLTYKHFVPLIPPKAKSVESNDDLGDGVLPKDLSVLASMSARVGSIGDNKSGG